MCWFVPAELVRDRQLNTAFHQVAAAAWLQQAFRAGSLQLQYGSSVAPRVRPSKWRRKMG